VDLLARVPLDSAIKRGPHAMLERRLLAEEKRNIPDARDADFVQFFVSPKRGFVSRREDFLDSEAAGGVLPLWEATHRDAKKPAAL
jgi:hypothetical protein